MTHYHVRQQKSTLSQFWRPEVQNQGVGRVSSFQNSGFGGVVPATPAPWWPQVSLACGRSTPASASILTWALSVATLTPDIFRSVSSLSRGDTASISGAQDWSPGMFPSRLATLNSQMASGLMFPMPRLHRESYNLSTEISGPCCLGQRFGLSSCDSVLLEMGPSGSCSTAPRPERDCGCLNTD